LLDFGLFKNPNKGKTMYSNRSRFGEATIAGIVLIVVLILGIILSISSCTVIQPGQVGVQVTFGSVNETSLGEGMHVVNPMSKIVDFDVRQQSHTEDNVNVTSQDQLVSQLDVSIQYTLNPKLASKILK
jgi:regulator of protease activity HflC (stomatin/prohibitin superfamily)